MGGGKGKRGGGERGVVQPSTEVNDNRNLKAEEPGITSGRKGNQGVEIWRANI